MVAVIKKLGSRGLPFRGSEEIFGSNFNGNFMMCLELIAEFDPFLATHIAQRGNPGKGNTSYLSSTICNEFITLMKDHLLKTICDEIRTAKYFSIIVDSTPDISHVDQLSLIIRYVRQKDTEESVPVERFISFIPNVGHKSEQLANVVCEKLKELDIEIGNCRGQSYDNASNMSGQYSGLQTRIKALNPLAIYVPCAAHSLNLVGTSAAQSCSDANNFFYTVQHVYTFLSGSTKRWGILQSQIERTEKRATKTVKSLSQTRWSARSKAVSSIRENYDAVKSALHQISQDVTEKPAIKNEAQGLVTCLEKPKFVFLLGFWNDTLERCNAVSQKLQSVSISISCVIDLYSSLIGFINKKREEFLFYVEEAKRISNNHENFTFSNLSSRIHKRKKQFDENIENEAQFETEEYKFKVTTYYVIIDSFLSELKRRKAAYEDVFARFSIFSDFTNTTHDEFYKKAENFRSFYQDVEKTFGSECIHFAEYIKLNFPNNTCQSVQDMYSVIKKQNLSGVFPNIEIAQRIYLCMAMTNCTSERSFSTLKRIKKFLRSSQSQEHTCAFGLFAIEADLLKNISFDELVSQFANSKVRRKAVAL